MESEEAEIERGQTGIRALYTILFLVIARVVETVLFVVILFELLYTAVTKMPPSVGIRRFANRTVTYFYRIGRYLTYNECAPPFPFMDLPEELEEPQALVPGSAERDTEPGD